MGEITWHSATLNPPPVPVSQYNWNAEMGYQAGGLEWADSPDGILWSLGGDTRPGGRVATIQGSDGDTDWYLWTSFTPFATDRLGATAEEAVVALGELVKREPR